MKRGNRTVIAAGLAVTLFAACSGGAGGEGDAGMGGASVSIAGLQALSGVTRVSVSAAPADVSVDLVANATAGTYTGTLSLPAGAQTLTARAYAGTTPVGEGSASVVIVGGETLNVTILVLDITGPGPNPDNSPVVTAVTSTPSTLSVAETATLRAFATDVDGDVMTFTWTVAPEGCGAVSPVSSTSTTSSTATFTAASAGTCTVTVQAASNGLSDSLSTSIDVLLPVNVGGVYVPQPSIGSIEFPAPAEVTMLRSSADSTVRHPWAPTVPVSVRVTWDDTPWLSRSIATLTDSCGGAVVSSSIGANHEVFTWTPASGPVCALTARVEREGLVDTFRVAVIVGPDPACTWSVSRFESLATLPDGAVALNGALNGQGPATVFGRSAWYQTSNWNHLFVPLGGLATADVVAVEADVYVAAPGDRSGFGLFQPATIAENLNGVSAVLSGPESAPWSPRFATWEFTAPGIAAVSRFPVEDYMGAWRTLRFETVRSLCRFRALLDGVELRRWDFPGCDLTGTYVNLMGVGFEVGVPAELAWSNLRLYGGSAPECLPAP